MTLGVMMLFDAGLLAIGNVRTVKKGLLHAEDKLLMLLRI